MKLFNIGSSLNPYFETDTIIHMLRMPCKGCIMVHTIADGFLHTLITFAYMSRSYTITGVDTNVTLTCNASGASSKSIT